MKGFYKYYFLVVAVFGVPNVLAGESESRIRNIERLSHKLVTDNRGKELESYSFSSRKGEVRSSIQCLGGYKFAIVSSVGHNAAPEPAVAIIQVQELVKDRIVPAKC